MTVPDALARATFPEPLLDVLRRLGAAGHRSWLVGGAVRDLLLHRPRPATDFDVATPATPTQVTALFAKVIPTGVEHGTVTVHARGEKIEVTTFRGEGAYLDGRRPQSVTFHTDVEADLARRDFTMNALAYDPLASELRDPFGGQDDLRAGLIRAVGSAAERFGEDGLRPLRAVRFAAQLGFALEPATHGAIPAALDVVRRVSVERVAEELSRLAVAPHAPAGLALLRETGLLGVALPALARTPDAALDHAGRVLGEVPPEPPLRFAALLHALAPYEAEAVLLGLRLPRRLAERVAALLRSHACPVAGRAGPDLASDEQVRRWLSRVGPALVAGHFALAVAEARSLAGAGSALAGDLQVRAVEHHVRAVLDAHPPLSLQDLALDGRAVTAILGAGPGAHVGEALRHLLDRVLADPAQNALEPLESELRRWWAARSVPRL